MDNQLATFVDVILPLPLPKLYTYRVPTDLINEVTIGKRVVVQFGKKKLYSALVFKISHQPPQHYEAKFLVQLLDDVPLVYEHQLAFWNWIADYYTCTLGDVMNAALPASLKLESETLVSLNPDCDLPTIELTDKEFLITEALLVATHLTIADIGNILDVKQVFNILKGLYTKGVITYIEDIKETYKPKTITCIKIGEAYQTDVAMSELFNTLEKTPKQLDVVMAAVHLLNNHTHLSKKQLLAFGDFSDSTLKTLVKKDILQEYKQTIDRIATTTDAIESFTLNSQQQNAFAQIEDTFKQKDVVLLHGITSSGKTHVYVKLIEAQLEAGKQVLLLLPEIALASQIVKRIKKYFGNRALSFHSKFNANQRVEIWQKIYTGEPLVLIGPRSTIFLPYKKLGLIIVDEEHETSYKQQDPAPRYHARDAAIFLAYTHGCKTLLGSATPSFESYYNAQQGKYGLVNLHSRFGEASMPTIEIGNIAEDSRTKSMTGHLTASLHKAINDTLQANEQVILFQNRRGFAPVMECQTCNNTIKCVNCDINLTYHKYNNSLKCHYCGFTTQPPQNCLACGAQNLHLKGFGTEKIEDEISTIFPTARLLRLDLDAAKGKHTHEDIIKKFEMHEADILIGTQMLSKGLDFGKVSLVGVINADQLLYFPDFRANERTYQLLTQVSGRAGRKETKGRVIIQTSTPAHHVIQEVMHQQYTQLFANEMAERERFGYPPFKRLIKITIKHVEYNMCLDAAIELQKLLYKRLGNQVIGPESPYVSRLRNRYVKELLVKMDKNSLHLSAVKTFIKQSILQVVDLKPYKQTLIYADVDPM